MKKEQFYEKLSIEPATKAIIGLVEEKTEKDFDFIDKPDLAVSASVKIARSFMPSHIVAFKRRDSHRLSHLIAHECGHILRYYSVPIEKRVIPVSYEEHRQRANNLLERTERKKLNKLPPDVAIKLKGMWIHGIVRQLTNLPVDYRIETWLYNDYPDLRPSQKLSLDADYSDALAETSARIEKITPDLIQKKSILMSSAFYAAIDTKLDTTYSKGFEKYSKGGFYNSLVMALQEEDQGFDQDIRIIGEWAETLNLRDWFAWGAFENVPENYANIF